MTVLEQMLEQTGSVVILGHVRPDGDCLGSTLGLYHYIQTNYPAIRQRYIWKKAHRSLDISQAMMRSSMKQMRNAMSFASVWTVEMKNGWDPLAFFLPMRQRVCVWITILPIPASAR